MDSALVDGPRPAHEERQHVRLARAERVAADSKGRHKLGVSRGALTFTRLFVQGKPPKDLRKRYFDAVRLRKFTPLTPEAEASEAVGWCVIERPFDLDFQPDRIFYDRFVQLGLRVDKWKIPGVL